VNAFWVYLGLTTSSSVNFNFLRHLASHQHLRALDWG
jgi:hypothetical protein